MGTSLIVRSISKITDTDRDVSTPNWRSKRIVLADDGSGFSLHETEMYANTVNEFCYSRHIEAVLVVEGNGLLVDCASGARWDLQPGVMYMLDNHDRHQVLPATDIRMICVFSPALTGREVHDETGAYPLPQSDE
jgi:L-ectoine synthase